MIAVPAAAQIAPIPAPAAAPPAGTSKPLSQSMSYIPDNILLPTVTVALDTEIGHIVTACVVATAVAAPYVTAALSAAFSGISASASATVTTFVTTAMNFMVQLSRAQG